MTPITVSYESLRQRHRQDLASRLPAFLAHGAWAREQIREERQYRLRRLLAHAKQHSHWHARRLAHIDPETFTEAGLPRIPPMTKADLMENFDQIVTDPRLTRATAEAHLMGLEAGDTANTYLFDRFNVIASSGSSGQRGVFPYDWSGWAIAAMSITRLAAVIARAVAASNDRARVVSVTAGTPSHFSYAVMQTFFPSTPIVPATLPLHEIVARLNELQPNRIVSYASILHQLGHAAEAGQLRIKPVAITSGGEPLAANTQATLERVFSARVFDTWGCSETGTLAQSCPKGPGLHLNEDIGIVEPVDEQGQRIGPEIEAAAVLVTNLFNMALPIIRYEVTDAVTFLASPGPCECGSQYTKIAPVRGRSSHFFRYGNLEVNTFPFESILERQSAIIDYRVQQTASGAHILVTASTEFDRDGVAAQISGALAAHGVQRPDITIDVTPVLMRGATGKLVRFVPLRQESAGL